MHRRLARAGLGQRTLELLDLPRDVVLDLPKVTLVGNSRVTVENHRGVIEYTSAVVRIATSRGEIRVVGFAMVVDAITREEVSVDGQIGSLEYVDWGVV